jgi:hypothetical protein
MKAAQYWEIVVGGGGIISMIGVGLRISYQLGKLVTEFRAYVKLNDIIVGKLDRRVETLEQFRRIARGGR